jgi:hypothetical protein
MAGGADDSDDTEQRAALPAVSRLSRVEARPYRVLTRSGGRYQGRDRYGRYRRQLPIEELMSLVIKNHGLGDAMREQCVFIFWREMAGARFADKTLPDSFAEGVLKVSAKSSAWVHEMQFFKTELLAQINAWVDAHRVWLGPSPLVTDIRFGLAMQKRQPLVDPEHVRRLWARRVRRLRPRELPPVVSDDERAAILSETSAVEDEQLRAAIERVRIRWNR